MHWIQTGIIAVICFLMARILIEARIHQQAIKVILYRKNASLGILLIVLMGFSYTMSLFFPNTVIVLAFIPILKYLLRHIPDSSTRHRVATLLGLGLIYSANIGGMGSMTGTPLNLVYMGFIQVNRLPGREHITFFTWLLFGIPLSLGLLALAYLVLKTKNRRFIQNFDPRLIRIEGDLPEGRQRMIRYILFFGINILLMLILSALQFFFRPPALLHGLNALDLCFLTYLALVFFFAFVYPRGKSSPSRVAHNLAFFIFHLLLLPLTAAAELIRDFQSRFSPGENRSDNQFHRWVDRCFQAVWGLLFRKTGGYSSRENPHSRVSVNRLITDLPYVGLVFMGAVIGIILLILKIGDDPRTRALDGDVIAFARDLISSLIPADTHLFAVLLLLTLSAIFLTEFVTNTTITLLMFSLGLSLGPVLGVSPVLLLLCMVVASSGAFMTPIATSVNAVVFGAIHKISFKEMVTGGLILNCISALFISGFFYLLFRWIPG